MDLGVRIASWRKWKGLSQKELAAKLKLTHAAVYQWEPDKKNRAARTTPSQVHIERLVKVLGITMTQFYGRVPSISKAG